VTPRAYSFDVFDTCLVRTITKPADLFFLLASEMLREKGLDRSRANISAVANLRLRAEQTARRRMQAQDLEIDAIYQALPELDPFGFDPEAMLRMELAMERKVLRPTPGMAERIHRLREGGARILFITDMYLPEDFIRARLMEHGMALPEDRLFVSGALGLTKHSGALFKHVLEATGLRPHELTHCGDNPHTDVRSPLALGIRVEPFETARLNALETALLTLSPEFAPELSFMAAAARWTRLQLCSESAPHRLAALAAGIVAPILTGFAAWVLDQAVEHGLKRLYFVSRDGQILLKIAKELSRNLDMECRYLHGSRQTWFLAALDGFDLERDRSWLFVTGHSKAPRDILRKLDLAPGDLAEMSDAPPPEDEFWSRQAAGSDFELLLALMGSPDFAAVVQARTTAAKQAALAYFRQEGLLDGEPVALVDIGWTLKAQQALRRILRASGREGRVHGMYFAVQAAHVPESELHAFDAFMLEQPRHFDPDETLNPVFRNANCIEQVFTAADHGLTTGYLQTPDGVIPTLAEPPGPERKDLVTLMHGAAQTYAALIAEQDAPQWRLDLLRRWCVQRLRDFLADPPKELALALADAVVYDDQNESRSRPLVRSIGPKGLLGALLGRTGRDGYRKGYDWLEGSIAISPAPLRPLLRHPLLFQFLRKYRISH
jgi:predicted HAD superfamily hydrolase